VRSAPPGAVAVRLLEQALQHQPKVARGLRLGALGRKRVDQHRGGEGPEPTLASERHRVLRHHPALADADEGRLVGSPSQVRQHPQRVLSQPINPPQRAAARRAARASHVENGDARAATQARKEAECLPQLESAAPAVHPLLTNQPRMEERAPPARRARRCLQQEGAARQAAPRVLPPRSQAQPRPRQYDDGGGRSGTRQRAPGSS